MKDITIQTYDCAHCSHSELIAFDRNDYARWQKGELIQLALDYLPADQREMMISATCNRCFYDFFS